MGKVHVVDSEALPWLRAEDTSKPLEDYSQLVEIEDESPQGGRILHPGSESELQLFEIRMPPDTDIPSHAHLNDEIIYVLSGELRMGSQVLKPGSSMYVGGDTLYGFRSGPSGLHFLNFRACKDLSAFSKQEFMARRELARNGSEEVAEPLLDPPS